VEDCFSSKAGTLRVPGNSFRTYQRTSQLPSHDQPCPSELPRSVRGSLSGRHPDLSKTPEEHERHVHQVLATLEDAQLLVEPGKAKWHAQEVKYLGYCINPGKIGMGPEKVRAIRDWPRPQNVKDVRSVLGFMNFYRRFVRGYSPSSDTPHTAHEEGSSLRMEGTSTAGLR